jgi:hypothetical protein
MDAKKPLSFLLAMNDDEYFDSAIAGYPGTSDFEWFAIDSVGHIALLTFAGYGPVPSVVFSSRDEYFACSKYFREREQSPYCTIEREKVC